MDFIQKDIIINNNNYLVEIKKYKKGDDLDLRFNSIAYTVEIHKKTYGHFPKTKYTLKSFYSDKIYYNDRYYKYCSDNNWKVLIKRVVDDFLESESLKERERRIMQEFNNWDGVIS